MILRYGGSWEFYLYKTVLRAVQGSERTNQIIEEGGPTNQKVLPSKVAWTHHLYLISYLSQLFIFHSAVRTFLYKFNSHKLFGAFK